jgi:predicted GH43/DUF377 family glycosyl hydrolase
MTILAIIFSFLFVCANGHADKNRLLDLEAHRQDFVLETKKIEIPGYPFAFNPSIIRWRGQLLMSFRIIPDPKHSFNGEIGLVFLNERFEASSIPQLLNLRDENAMAPCRAEDARLIAIGDRLFMIYDDNPEMKISKGGFRVYVAELIFDSEHFIVENIECLSHYEGESREIREKGWVPFIYRDHLLLAYSISPHKIFFPHLDGSGFCDTVACTQTHTSWDFGILRGGTPALIENDQYLAIFHSSKKMASLHSGGKEILHYFMGAYTFSNQPPFNITAMSTSPIIGRNFYNGIEYKHYWKPIRCVFPCGFLSDPNFIWIAYGRDDHECWVAKLDKQGLLQSLVPVSNDPAIFETDDPIGKWGDPNVVGHHD